MLLAFQACETSISGPNKNKKNKKNNNKLSFSYYTHAQYRAARARSLFPRPFLTTVNGSSHNAATILPEYGCFVEVKQGTNQWRYWSVALHYPKGIAEKAGGKKIMVKLHTVSAKSDSLLQLANCVVPLTSRAITMVKQLGMKGLQNVHEVHFQQPRPPARVGGAAPGINPTQSEINSDQPDCYGGPVNFGANTYYGDITLYCPANACWTYNGDFMTCQYSSGRYTMPSFTVVGENGGGGSPGGTGGNPGGGFPGSGSDDSGVYNPPSHGPPGGGTDTDPCTSCGPGDDGDDGNDRMPTAQPVPEPCKNTGTILDNLDAATQQALAELWQDSNYGSTENPNPEGQRQEVSGFLIPNHYSGYHFQRLKTIPGQDIERGPCFLNFKYPEDLPEGTIFVHVHPYSEGEIQDKCGEKTYVYTSIPGDDDEYAVERMGITGIFMDAEEIIFYDKNEITDRTNRCGY